MAAASKTCSDCGNQFRGRASATYCSPACRQRAHRVRNGAKRRGLRLVSTDAPQPGPASPRRRKRPPRGEQQPVDGHSERARAVLAALDAEQVASASAHNVPLLEWSAREAAVRDLVASTVDLIVDLERVYESVMAAESPDGRLLVTVSTELRLQKTCLAGLLKQVSPDLPTEPSRTSQKARRAVQTRWKNERARNV